MEIVPREAILIHFLVAQSHVGGDVLGVQNSQLDGVDNLFIPLVHVLVHHHVFDHVVTEGGFGVAYEIHDVVAILGLDNAVVANLTLGIEAPIVEVGNHLTGIDVLVQTAGLSVVIGVLLSQISKAFLAQITVLDPVSQDALSFFLGSLLLLIGVGGGAGGGIGGTAGELDQNVADILQCKVVIVAALDRKSVV